MDHLLNNRMELKSITTTNVKGTAKETEKSLGFFKCRWSRTKSGSNQYRMVKKEIDIVEGELDLYISKMCPVVKGNIVVLEIGKYTVVSDPHHHTGFDGSIHHTFCRLSRLV